MDCISFKINGESYSVGCEVSSDVTLCDYLRNYLQLRGTKYMCRQAGCGACVVAAVQCPGSTPQAVNSCMVSITSCSNWEITTIEHLGNRKKGYHVLQKTLADHNGSQCGYCSPGWIMSMYCLLQSKKDPTMLEIEKSFGGNICRCTGYRPILDAFKTFAKDHPKNFLLDIEDLNICEKTGRACNKSCSSDDEEWCVVSRKDLEETVKVLKLKDNRKWFQVNKIADVFSIFQSEGTDSYMLVAGNTAKGAYPMVEYPHTLIDITCISELKGCINDQNLAIGAGNTLTELLKIFKNWSQIRNFRYLNEFYEHLQLVAHIAVRNLGTIGGNLMIKHQHHEFQSDLFLMFVTVGAAITIMNKTRVPQTVSMTSFLKKDMNGFIIMNVKLPPLRNNCRVKTFKVMPRSESVHAVVNFGALYEFTPDNDRLQNCRLAFGGLSPTFTRAVHTETNLIGKPLFTNETLQSAIRALENELVVKKNPPEPSAAYRKKLAIALFYKSLLSLCPTNILDERYISGTVKLHESRPVSEARQCFETDSTLWPLTKPISKLESLIQCAGEACYTEDLPSFPNEVFAELVLSTVAKGTIVSMNPSKALKFPDVIAFYTAKDIPGLNSFTPADDPINTTNEEVLCSGEVKYFNQPIAVVVGKTRHIAEVASKLIIVTYTNVVEPVLDIKEAKNDIQRNTVVITKNATEKGDQVARIVKGGHTMSGQFHFTMETFAVVTRASEEGLEVYATCQIPDALQIMVSQALNMDANKIDVLIRRVGGGFGFKITRIILPAVVCSLVTKKLNVPCRVIHTIEKLMRAYGKRFPWSNDYEFAVDENGIIQYGNMSIYEDNGYSVNEKLTPFGADVYNNCYEKSRWDFKSFDTITDTAKNSWFRSPATLEHIASIEMVMEHISYDLSKDPVEVRIANLDPETADEMERIINTTMDECEYKERRDNVNTFNARNRWKKRGLRFVPMRYNHSSPKYFDVNISIYHGDGTVAITHGGIEIGQGINTKTAQICAYILDIPLDKIQVKGNSTINTPNSAVTGGSLTCHTIGVATKRACEELLKRLAPVKAKLNNPSWKELISKAYEESVDLQGHGFTGNEDLYKYHVYAAALVEVEIDVLTGESEIRRVDVLYDAGQSVSPALDIGQIEGAFVLGTGYWTSESLVYKSTGELLSDRPWHYHVPLARDIPQDFRVHLLKGSYSYPDLMGSKMVGEPPMCTTVSVHFAIREAVAAARCDSGSTSWYDFAPHVLSGLSLFQGFHEMDDSVTVPLS